MSFTVLPNITTAKPKTPPPPDGGTMLETMHPRKCPKCNSRNTGVTANGYDCRYFMRCHVCQCRWKVFNRKSMLSPIEIIEDKEV